MKRCCILALLLLSTNFITAQDASSQLDFSLLRQNDKVKVDSNAQFYPRIKQIHLAKETFLSLGGSQRFQVEGFINEEFDKAEDQTNLWYLSRTMLHAHIKQSNWFELFAELNSSLIESKENLAPVDKDLLAINQLFVKLKFRNFWSVNIGRQNLRLGSGRLIDVREGPNVRRSFDMIDFKYEKSNTVFSVFLGGPSSIREGLFDNDVVSSSEWFTGIYWTNLWSSRFKTDVYLIYKEEEEKIWNSGMADDQRLSIGLRCFGEFLGLTFNNEFVYQLGGFGEERIYAWTISFDLKKDIVLPKKRQLAIGLKTELISGDRNVDDNVLNTFDGLYPRGAYFGRVARFGPSNLYDLHPYFEFQIEQISFVFDYVAFWRLSNADGVYGPPLNLAYPSNNDKSFIGHQFGGIIGYNIGRHVSLELESNLIITGGFLDNSDLKDNLVHVVFTSEFKF